MDGLRLDKLVHTQLLILFGLLFELCDGGTYCLYLHEDYYTFNRKYCESGCCDDYGDEDDICCFSWTIGIIIGICFACIGFICLAVFIAVCCYSMKKRNRAGQIINPAPTHAQNNMVVYTAAAGYSYPHPPSGFYPGSRFPGQAPPPYTAGTHPAYPPTFTDQSQGPSAPLPSGLYGPPQTGDQSAIGDQSTMNKAPPPYFGYGTGQS